MNTKTYNNENLTAYLLGALPEADAEGFDELSFTDDDFASELSAAEKDLVDAYVNGELKGEKLQSFESYYLASPLRREKVEFARVFQQFAAGDGSPDGMTVDSEGCLWMCFWDGGCVRRFSPEGEWLETIEMPVSRPTSLAFGGRDLDELYISSASIGLDDEARKMQPNAGGLFMLRPGVQGIADVPFAG